MKKNGEKKRGKNRKKKRRRMKIVTTTSLPAVDRPNADRWNAACSCQNHFKCLKDLIRTFYHQKFVVSAAHCFCKKEYGKCTENNDKQHKKLTKLNGHFTYKPGTRNSR